MTRFNQCSQARRPISQSSPHHFRIGQIVRMTSHFGVSHITPDFYCITAMLPPRDGSPQYRIRSDEERHERVVTQDMLEATDIPTP